MFVFCARVFDLFETEKPHIFLVFNIKIHKGRCQCGLEDTFTNRPKNIINYTFHGLQGYQSSFELNILYMSSILRLQKESWVFVNSNNYIICSISYAALIISNSASVICQVILINYHKRRYDVCLTIYLLWWIDKKLLITKYGPSHIIWYV